jgi:plasmid maintenance system antidote protein VapI
LTIKKHIFLALGLTTAEAADQLSFLQAERFLMLNGIVAISPNMTLRLEKWLGIKN